ncbi:MAG: sarcosine oxidase subunit gamma [Pseudomonadota bacterium]|nr:sarcosine oxidase subunit gamma [Pseudomonadota bacterium]
MVETAARTGPAVPTAAWLTPLPPAERFAFYGGAAARAAAAPLWGPVFSEKACRAHAHATRATLWLGPDEYLLLDLGAGGAAPGRSSRVSPTFSALEQALIGIPHALVDISHRQFALEVSGPHAATLLSGACPLDLDLGEFPVDTCTRTVLAKADIVLWRTQENAFHLEVWRSFAGYVTGILSEIAAEFHTDG